MHYNTQPLNLSYMWFNIPSYLSEPWYKITRDQQGGDIYRQLAKTNAQPNKTKTWNTSFIRGGDVYLRKNFLLLEETPNT